MRRHVERAEYLCCTVVWNNQRFGSGRGFGLIAIVVIVFVDVLMRYVFTAPILRVNQIVQLTAGSVAMFALPSCTARRTTWQLMFLASASDAKGAFRGHPVAHNLGVCAVGVVPPGRAQDA